MKHIEILCLLATFFVATALNAQTEKGTFSLGFRSGSNGSGMNGIGTSFTTDKSWDNGVLNSESLKRSSFGLNLNTHYFVVSRLSIGINVGYNRIKQWQEGALQPNKQISWSSAYGPELYYYFPLGKKLSLKVGERYQKIESKYDKTKYQKPKVFSLESQAGVALFVTRHISLDFILFHYYSRGYRVSNSPFEEIKSTFNGVGVNFGFSAYF
jgi:hypothetical protein